MNFETWHILVGLTILIVVFGIAVGIIGFDPVTVTVSLIAIIIGLAIGFRLSPQ